MRDYQFLKNGSAICKTIVVVIIIIIIITFTTTHLQQTMFSGHTVLQLFSIYNLCYMSCYFAQEICFVLLH